MKRLTRPVSLALTAFALLGLAAPGIAQQQPQDLVAFKATITGAAPPFFAVPLDPPIAVGNASFSGQSDLLGAVTWTATSIIHFNADGTPARETDGVVVMAAANGDALFLSYSGFLRITQSGLVGEQRFTITGGKGRFLGATGSGGWMGSVDAKNQVTLVLEGTVSRPKP